MSNKIKQVIEFHEAFGVENNTKPTLINDSKLRFELMKEENEEYLEACKNNDMIEILDACVDMQYILNGTIARHGLKDVFNDAFDEVHGSNMSKLGEDGKPIYREDGKILKGKNYYKPNLAKVLEKSLKTNQLKLDLFK